jgi:hypothetical protein
MRPRVTRNEQFGKGYDEAIRQWHASPLPDEHAAISLINPYVRDSDGWHGFEQAVYDLTQK